MATLGTQYVQIVPSTEGIEGKLKEALGMPSESAGESAGGKMMGAIKKVIAGAGIGVALKKTLDAGGALQQSIGGIETIFGDSADKMKAYASNAYETAGLSANSYMEQATRFGASLKQTLDDATAGEYANKALIQMSDNANKMGTNIESLQNAYAGFAKGNFSMLDNLSLGYGGTQAEMVRLINDSGILNEKIESLDGISFDQMIDAIGVVQDNLGITGTTAEEASTTLSGSMASMKGAFENFLGNLALGENIGPSLEGLASATSTFLFGNLLPMVGNILMQLPSVVGEGLTIVGPQLLEFLRNGIFEGIPTLMETAPQIISDLCNSFNEQLPSILNSGSQIVGELLAGLISNIPSIISGGMSIVGSLLESLLSAIPLALEFGGNVIKTIADQLGITGTIKSAAEGIKNTVLGPIETLKSKVSEIVEKIKGFFNFSVATPHIPIPHFSISPAGWSVGDLVKGSIPSLSISWNKEGGIYDRATLIGVGEAGKEAILPLDPFWKRIERMEKSMNASSINVYMTVNASEGMDVKQLARQVERELVSSVRRERFAWT